MVVGGSGEDLSVGWWSVFGGRWFCNTAFRKMLKKAKNLIGSISNVYLRYLRIIPCIVKQLFAFWSNFNEIGKTMKRETV